MPIRKRVSRKNRISYLPYVNYYKDGKTYKRYGKTCYTLEDAEQLIPHLEREAQIIQKLNNFWNIDEPSNFDIDTISIFNNFSDDRTTWDEAYLIFRKYKVNQKVGFSQLDHYDTRFRKYIQPFFKNKTLETTKKMDVFNFQSFLINIDQANYTKNKQGPLSATTINKIMELSKSIFVTVNDLKELNLKIPFKIKPIKREPYISDYYTEEEFLLFYNVIDNLQDKILFNLLFTTGIRIGEATALTFNDFLNRKDEYLKIYKTRKRGYRHDANNTIGTPKTPATIREVLINDELESNILKYRQSLIENEKYFTDDWFVFGGKKPIAFQTVRRHNSKYAEAAGLPPIRIHDFRGSFTTHVFKHTSNIQLVKNALGHTDYETTFKYYLKSRNSDKQELSNIFLKFKKK